MKLVSSVTEKAGLKQAVDILGRLRIGVRVVIKVPLIHMEERIKRWSCECFLLQLTNCILLLFHSSS